MKEKPHCLECGLVKSASPHATDHDFVAPPRPGFGEKKRQPLNPRSAARQTYYREQYVPAVKEAVGKPCEIKSPVCTGVAESIHESATRGRFGGLPNAVASGPTFRACLPCNSYCSTHPIWARERGFLLSNTVDGTKSPPRIPPRRNPTS